ncbi:MAG: hypothetical protein ACYC4U_01575 [Pirellulaceae bacterium]
MTETTTSKPLTALSPTHAVPKAADGRWSDPVARGPFILLGALALSLVVNLLACRQSTETPLGQQDQPPRRTTRTSPAGDRTTSRRPPAGKIAVVKAQRHAKKSSLPADDPFRAPHDTPPGNRGIAEAEDDPSTVRSPLLLPSVDLGRLEGAGIRKIEGVHLTLYTDVSSQPEVDELPRVFDLAVKPWCAYFHVLPGQVANWKMTAYLMDRKERFQGTGLLPDDLPPFLNGYQRGFELWVYEQPSAYYRRHLLLHEGTHAFMNGLLHGCGPPWYMEGMAELLGTHRWQDGDLQLAYFPQRRAEVEQWGRIKMIHTEVAAGRSLSLESVLALGPTAHLQNEPYAWCWAAAAFLDGHPQFSTRFRQLPQDVLQDVPKFTASFWRMFESERRQLIEQWQLFVLHLDYGYDLQAEAIVYDPPGTVLSDAREVRVRADRGWQSTGIRVEAGATYVLEASGRYQIARTAIDQEPLTRQAVVQEPRIWWCEPGGVTIRYYGGRPLGMLLAAISDESLLLTGLTPFAKPEVIGLGAELSCAAPGTLFLRVNDAPSELVDNAGDLVVRVGRKK